ncbi:MAG: FAD/NAD(P)-binding oxidoreductase [Dehalococcoidia bacterium]
MQSYKHLILGGGMVAGYAVQRFLQDGVGGHDIGILSADSAPPYERPPLSKGFLLGKEEESSVYINQPESYAENGVGLHLSTEVASVDLEARTVSTTSGDFAFENLLIATGSAVRKLDVPGADLAGVLYLRSLADSKRLKEAIASAGSVVVVGSGFIGMEVASSAAQQDTKVTMVYPEDRLWQRFLSPELSDYFARYYQERGVELVPNDSVVEIIGDGSAGGVRTESGRRIKADAVVAGIGVTPVTGYLDGSGLRIDNGVRVNEFLETGTPGVWAAGDIAHYRDVIFNKDRRVEHWDNAVEQGKHVAASMQGRREPFVHVPYYFSDIFDLSYEFWGDTEEADEVIHRADWEANSVNAMWFKGNRLVAALLMNRPDEERDEVQEWIREGTDLSGRKKDFP